VIESSGQGERRSRKPRLNPLYGTRRSATWAQDAKANIAILRTRMELVKDRPASQEIPRAKEFLDAVAELLDAAERAAEGRSPRYWPLISAWSGTCIEAAFKNVHSAEAALVYLYEPAEMRAEIPEAVWRAKEALELTAPIVQMCEDLQAFRKGKDPRETEVDRARKDLSKIIEMGHMAADRQRSRLRTFRNTVLIGVLLTFVLVGLVIWVGYARPSMVPLCFMQDVSPAPPANDYACPTGQGRTSGDEVTRGVGALASPGDALAVALMGLLGGALSAGIFIRRLYLQATSYNVLIPLALAKLPAGAMTAIVGLVVLAGEFIPGFTAIDKQSQILAYALAFGFAQQTFTKLLDRRAEELASNIPTKVKGGAAGSAKGGSVGDEGV
jgi:hypothetical protein